MSPAASYVGTEHPRPASPAVPALGDLAGAATARPQGRGDAVPACAPRADTISLSFCSGQEFAEEAGRREGKSSSCARAGDFPTSLTASASLQLAADGSCKGCGLACRIIPTDDHCLCYKSCGGFCFITY